MPFRRLVPDLYADSGLVYELFPQFEEFFPAYLAFLTSSSQCFIRYIHEIPLKFGQHREISVDAIVLTMSLIF